MRACIDSTETDACSDPVNILHDDRVGWSDLSLRVAATIATNRAITQTGFQTLSRNGQQETTVVLGTHPELPVGHHFKVLVRLVDGRS